MVSLGEKKILLQVTGHQICAEYFIICRTVGGLSKDHSSSQVSGGKISHNLFSIFPHYSISSHVAVPAAAGLIYFQIKVLKKTELKEGEKHSAKSIIDHIIKAIRDTKTSFLRC